MGQVKSYCKSAVSLKQPSFGPQVSKIDATAPDYFEQHSATKTDIVISSTNDEVKEIKPGNGAVIQASEAVPSSTLSTPTNQKSLESCSNSLLLNCVQ